MVKVGDNLINFESFVSRVFTPHAKCISKISINEECHRTVVKIRVVLF